MSTRDLFETIKVRGWRRNGGVSINAGGFRHYIVKKLYKEADRGAVFGQKLMDTFSGINTGIEMPVIDRHDEAWHYSLSQMLLPREAEFVEENEGDDEPRDLDLGRYELWQRHEGRGACRPAKIMHSDDIPEDFYLMMAQDMLLRHRGDATDEVVRVLPSASTFAAGTPQKVFWKAGEKLV